MDSLKSKVCQKICDIPELLELHNEVKKREDFGSKNPNKTLMELLEKVKGCINDPILYQEYLAAFFNSDNLIAGCCAAFLEAQAAQLPSPAKKSKKETAVRGLSFIDKLAIDRIGRNELIYFSPEDGAFCKDKSKTTDISRTCGQTLMSAVFAQEKKNGTPSSIFKLICSELAAGRLQIGGKSLEQILSTTE